MIQHFKIKVIHYIKRLSKKNHIIISIDAEKYSTEFTIHSLLKQNKQTKNTFQPIAIFPNLINSFSVSSLLLCNNPQTYIPNNYCLTGSGGSKESGYDLAGACKLKPLTKVNLDCLLGLQCHL